MKGGVELLIGIAPKGLQSMRLRWESGINQYFVRRSLVTLSGVDMYVVS